MLRLALASLCSLALATTAVADDLPRVLILGDSISIGYTPYVQEALEGEAVVVRPMRDEKRAENCQGTTYGVEHVERWLAEGDWDAIHFNFGLHDMKRVDPKTGAASSNPEHPRQSSPEKYEEQLRQIVAKLKKTGAKLILATTTPVPEGGVKPHRDVEDPERYNALARKIAHEAGASVIDLYGFAKPRLEEIQRPVNVHFTPEGSRALAGQVVESVRQALRKESDDAAKKPTNFVFVLVDDLGYMDVGCNNPDTFYETPNIDRLAAGGMRFTDGYAANPVCSPTRYSIMTGKYPSRVDATNYFSGRRAERFLPAPLNDRMPLNEATLAEALKEHGYATFFAGKWHLGPTAEFWPENQGFDINKGGHSRGGPYGGDKYFSPYGNPRLEDGPVGEHLPERLASETVEFMKSHRDGPFLAYLAFYSVHTPLMAPADLVAKYREKAKRLKLDQKVKFTDEEQVWPVDERRRVRIVQSHAVYAAMVEAMDRAVGKVLDALDELGLAENTAVILTSDNGGLSTSEGSPTSNLPLRGGKGWLYEGGIREPFLVRLPGTTKPGAVCSTPVITTDFYPTMLQIAGLPARPEQHLDGVSILSLLEDGEAPKREALYWHYPHYSNQGGMPGAAVRMGDWKLIERFEDGRVHLYNLASDIGEENDLAADYPDRVAAMREKLHTWYDEVDAKFLQAKPDGPKPWRPKGS